MVSALPTRDRALPAAAGALRIQILGPLRLWRDGVELDLGPRQQCCLLALFLAREGRPTGIGDLVELVWGENPPASALNVIHKYVGALRRLMEPDLTARSTGSHLLRHGNGYLFAAGPGMLDLVTFRQFVTAARAELAAERPDDALDNYVEALRLWHGPAGGASVYGTAATSIFAALDGEFLDVCAAAADLAVAQRQPARVLPALRLAASMAPLHEPVQASLVATLAAAGQQAEALAVFQAVRERLADELGIDPGHTLQAAHRRVLRQTVMPELSPPGGHQADREPAAPRAHAPVVPPAQLPPDLPTFVGRDDELAALNKMFDALCAGNRTYPLIVALDGMGGVGKSTLAAHFAHTVVDRLTDGQLYLDLRGHEDDSVPAGDALRSLLSSLGAQASSIPDSVDARTATYRSLTAGKRILILLDNVRDVAQVRPLLPNSAESLVLVTSRRPLVGLAALDGAHLVHVDLPDMPCARALLRRRLERSPHRSAAEIASSAEVLEEIIELCGRLPLALAILAGRLSARPRLSLGAVAAELRDGAQKLAAFPGGSGVSDPRAAFAWSYRQLSADAARLFRLFSAALVPPGISAHACASLFGERPQIVGTLLEELTEAALLDEDDHGRFSSHVLVKAYAEELFRTEESPQAQQAARSRLLQHYLHSSYHAVVMLAPRRSPIAPPPPLTGVVAERPADFDAALQWFEDHQEVLLDVVRHAAEPGSGVVPWQLALTMQPSLQWSGRFHDWQDVMRISLRAALDSGDPVGEAHALRSLAGARHSLGANEEALELLSDAQRIFAAHDMLPEQGIVHTNFHRIYSELGRHELALQENEKALALYRAAGNEQAEVWALEARGRSLVQLGAFDEAREMLGKALALNQKSGRRTDEPEIRMYTAQNLVQMGQLHEAVEQLELGLRAAVETKNRVDKFQVSIMLAEVLLSVDDLDGARRAWRRAGDLMADMQNGGTQNMRDSVFDLGAKLAARQDLPGNGTGAALHQF
ncbi:BTAD domain-containing putative transcriptional regulator [Winogradskya consettensis]|uniref:SARP family transcriptional regulator n=1 Tax=Winogradskya consettensis TaxID=113560 RepID=A0A919VLT8_9ACTN|nr:BTAD domain-containing putative transcriptional regulator [Actinoplanes consettensis]GIM68051.1 SARP family transcriptional regulator [Actinoplanes consettensis]